MGGLVVCWADGLLMMIIINGIIGYHSGFKMRI